MRSLLVALALMSSPCLSLAQQSEAPTDKGWWLVGGSASISHRSDDNADVATTIYSLSPNLMYFVAPRLAMGGILGISRVESDNSKGTGTTIGPALRYYFASASPRTLPYVGATAQILNQRFTSSGIAGDFTTRVRSTTLEGFAGATLMVSRQVGFYGEAFYNQVGGEIEFTSTSPVVPGDIEQTNMGIRFGIAAFVR